MFLIIPEVQSIRLQVLRRTQEDQQHGLYAAKSHGTNKNADIYTVSPTVGVPSAVVDNLLTGVHVSGGIYPGLRRIDFLNISL